MAQHTQIANSLKEAFSIRKGEVISLVGAGGKSSLMQALADELAATGGTVITTTTTKIFDWQAPSPHLIVEADEDKMLGLLLEALGKYRHVTLAKDRLLQSGKLDGISPQLVKRLVDLEKIDYIIIEADGAARKPIKAPNATEPVMPPNTTLVIAIVGIDALNKELNSENAFRPEIISGLTGLLMNEKITTDTIVTLLTRSQGITKGSPPQARIIPFINKVDSDEDLRHAEEIADKILALKPPNITQVVAGQIVSPAPSLKIIRAE